MWQIRKSGFPKLVRIVSFLRKKCFCKTILIDISNLDYSSQVSNVIVDWWTIVTTPAVTQRLAPSTPTPHVQQENAVTLQLAGSMTSSFLLQITSDFKPLVTNFSHFLSSRPKPPGSTCRPADHECDLPEYCNGDTEFCPSDIFKVDGTTCKAGKAYCYQGACRTHTDQVKKKTSWMELQIFFSLHQNTVGNNIIVCSSWKGKMLV